jgi:NADH-quinone oxidoreductase subunit M
MLAWLSNNLLSAVIFSPAVLAIPLMFFPKNSDTAAKVYTLLASLLVFLLSLKLYFGFAPGVGELQMVSVSDGLPAMGIRYAVGIDGISLFLVILTTFLVPIIVLSAWHAVEDRVKQYLFFLLFLESAILGAFLALDLFLFYVFWEAMLIPMFFLIGIWGGKDRIYAAKKFLLYTAAGSVPMLVAIIYLLFAHKTQFGAYSALITDIYKLNIAGGTAFSAQGLIFLAFALAFAIKVPLFPLHTWLPDA